MMAGNIVPPMLVPKMDENIPERAAGKTQKSNLPGNPAKMMIIDLRNFLKIWILVEFSCRLNKKSGQLETFCQSINIILQWTLVS